MAEENEVTTRFNFFVTLVSHIDTLVRHTQKDREPTEFRYPMPTSNTTSEPTMRELGDEIEKLSRSFVTLSFQMDELSTMLSQDEDIECDTPKMAQYKTKLQNVFTVMRPLNRAVMALTTFILPLGHKPKQQTNGKFGRLVKLVPPRAVVRR